MSTKEQDMDGADGDGVDAPDPVLEAAAEAVAEDAVPYDPLSRGRFFVAGDQLVEPSDAIRKISAEMGAARRAATSDDL